MRQLVVATLVACGPAATQTPAPRPAAIAPAPAAPAPTTTPPALPTFAAAGEIYMLVADDQPRCEAWRIDPANRKISNTTQLGAKTITRTIDFRVEGKTLHLDDTAHLERERGETTGDQTSSCGMQLEIRETDQLLVLDTGAKWFRTRAGCEAAIEDRARVATELCMSLEIDSFVFEPHQPTRKRFHALLAKGGTTYSIVDGPKGETCKPVRIRPHGNRKRGDTTLEGEFEWPVVRDDGVKGVEALGYSLDPKSELEAQQTHGPMAVTGPGTTWADGSGSAFGCLGFATPIYHDGFVELSEPMYFTRDACRAAIKREAARTAWIPLPPGEEVAEAPIGETTPGIGGC